MDGWIDGWIDCSGQVLRQHDIRCVFVVSSPDIRALLVAHQVIETPPPPSEVSHSSVAISTADDSVCVVEVVAGRLCAVAGGLHDDPILFGLIFSETKLSENL